MLGQEGKSLAVEGVESRVGAREDHDEDVGLGEDGGEAVLGNDLDAVADTGGAGDTLDLCAENAETGDEALCDVAKAPDENAGVA